MSAATAVAPARTPAPDPEPARPTAKPTVYRVGIDKATLERVLEFAGEHVEGFDDKDRFPVDLGPLDFVYLAKATAGTREQAVDRFLDGDTLKGVDEIERSLVVRAAERAEVELTFLVVPDTFVGEVPVKTTIERRRRVGRS